MPRACWGTDRVRANIIALDGQAPRIDDTAFIASGCQVIGDVEIGADASLWYNCVVRGDVNRIRIGARTNIQDGSVIHCDSPAEGQPEGWPTLIGDDCLVGHMVLLHGCTLHDRAFVGMGAMVMNGAVIESDAMLAAGSLLTPGKRIASGQLWAGRPAKYLRDLSPEEIEANRIGVAHYVENGRRHAAALKGD